MGTSPSTGAGPRERLSRWGGAGRGAGSPAPVSRVAPATPPPGDGPPERDGSRTLQLLRAGPHPTLPGRRARMRSRGAARSLQPSPASGDRQPLPNAPPSWCPPATPDEAARGRVRRQGSAPAAPRHGRPTSRNPRASNAACPAEGECARVIGPPRSRDAHTSRHLLE